MYETNWYNGAAKFNNELGSVLHQHRLLGMNMRLLRVRGDTCNKEFSNLYVRTIYNRDNRPDAQHFC